MTPQVPLPAPTLQTIPTPSGPAVVVTIKAPGGQVDSPADLARALNRGAEPPRLEAR